MHRCALVCLIVFTVVSVAKGYKNGPPVATHPEICGTMFPSGHGVEAKTTAAPYELVVSDTCYKEGSMIKGRVRVENADDEESFFEGFFILARKTDNTNTSYGMFDNLNTNYIQTLSCDPGTGNALGHSAAKHYLARTFQWTAPASNEGTIRLVATVVREVDEIWMNVMSAEIAYLADCNTTAYLADEDFDDIDQDAPCSSSHETCGATTASLHYVLFTITMAVALLFFKC